MKWYCSEPLLESLCECICDSVWLIDQGKSHSSESGVISASSLLTEHAGKQTYLQEPFQCRDWKYWRMNTLATHFPIFKQEFCNLSFIYYNVYSFLAYLLLVFTREAWTAVGFLDLYFWRSIIYLGTISNIVTKPLNSEISPLCYTKYNLGKLLVLTNC